MFILVFRCGSCLQADKLIYVQNLSAYNNMKNLGLVDKTKFLDHIFCFAGIFYGKCQLTCIYLLRNTVKEITQLLQVL